MSEAILFVLEFVWSVHVPKSFFMNDSHFVAQIYNFSSYCKIKWKKYPAITIATSQKYIVYLIIFRSVQSRTLKQTLKLNQKLQKNKSHKENSNIRITITQNTYLLSLFRQLLLKITCTYVDDK